MHGTTKIDGVARRVVSRDEWQRALHRVEAHEKAHMREGDKLAAERRRMPWMKIDGEFLFEGASGTTDLAGLFEGRSQLILYHFMFGPRVPGWPDAGCVGCSMFADQVGHLAHLRARGVSFAFVSSAPFERVEPYRRRMGWSIPWYSASEEFQRACDISDETGNSFGLDVFYRDGTDVYRTYFVGHRGVESIGTVWSLLDRTPLGRQERWQDVPEGSPQGDPYQWWRRHDEYPKDA